MARSASGLAGDVAVTTLFLLATLGTIPPLALLLEDGSCDAC